MPTKQQLLKLEMPTVSMQKGKHSISYLNMIFNHSSSMTYNMEMNFSIEPNDEENVCTTNSIHGEFAFKLHANFQNLIDLIEPLIRSEIGVADTTGVDINFIRIYPKHVEGHIFVMAISCKATCSTIGCASQEHVTDIEYIPEIFVRVNKILENTGFRLNIDIEEKANEITSDKVIDNRTDILDIR